MRCIPVVQPHEQDGPTRPRRSPRISVAPRTAVHESVPDRCVRFNVAYPIIDARPEPLSHGELALEHLASPPNSPERIASDDEERGVGRHQVATACADLLFQRFLNTGIFSIGRLCNRLYQDLACIIPHDQSSSVGGAYAKL